MKVKLKDGHPNSYVKAEVKPGFFLSINKSFHKVPEEYYDVLSKDDWFVFEDAPVKSQSKSVQKETKKDKSSKKKKKSFAKALL